MEPATEQQPDPRDAVVQAMAVALNARDHCIAGQVALIGQLMAENAALRAKLATAAKDD